MRVEDGVHSSYESSSGEELPFTCPKCGNKTFDVFARSMEGKSFYIFDSYYCTQCHTHFLDPEAFMNGTDTYDKDDA